MRAGADGQITHLRDVARIELGADSYALRSLLDNKPAVALPIFQRARLQRPADVRRRARHHGGAEEELSRRAWSTPSSTTPPSSCASSIEAVVHTLFEAILLVVLVVILFLQTWRASIIPLIAVPVSLVGTFAVMLSCSASRSTP